MKTRNYTPEIKERAVRMLIEASSDYPSTWSAIQANEIIRKAAAFFAQAEFDRPPR